MVKLRAPALSWRELQCLRCLLGLLTQRTETSGLSGSRARLGLGCGEHIGQWLTDMFWEGRLGKRMTFFAGQLQL